jgi:hypothetical protein
VMDCSCDFDPPEFYNCETRRARKRYRCEECRYEIQPGEVHEYVSGKWEGYLNSFRTCQRCVDLRVWVQRNVPCLCWQHGRADESLKDAVDDAYRRAPDEVVGLRFGLLRRFAARDRFNKSHGAGASA